MRYRIILRNIGANYIGTVWVGLVTLFCTPVYLRILGGEQWGLVAACIAVQGFLALLDAGLSQIVPRDVAFVGGDPVKERHVFGLYSRIYGLIGLLGFLGLQSGAGYLANNWFVSSSGQSATIEFLIRCVSVQFLFQFMNNVSIGFLSGVQRQHVVNLSQCLFVTLKNLTALSLMMVWEKTAEIYVYSFMLFSAVEFLVNRLYVTRLLDFSTPVLQSFSFSEIHSKVRDVVGLSAGVLLGLLVTQLDRIILSNHLETVDFGIYVVVCQIGIALLQLQYPITRALYPVVSRDALNKGGVVDKRLIYLLMLLMTWLPGLVMYYWSKEILGLWMGGGGVAASVEAAFRLIVLAVCIGAPYNIIYMQMAANNAKTVIFYINASAAILILAIVPGIAGESGMISGGFCWLTSATVSLSGGVAWLLWNHFGGRGKSGY
jgi:O-antigen/teichoic acid export membrane protein